ncbi:unnamed protein product [Vitrella brassicaformis CCMP3155]|uniref:Uncharacterized protein n=3 Tax=Vitrella brassicaformis TaxID=1169539 RepID=A0A0G4F2E5_VITBC|nr:unnamed protein product [Vitrella brassicaformis CCMP3155]|eukprot:CEM06359.1 unnamed protein product [Vitrella brassicaformis CCMP3155]
MDLPVQRQGSVREQRATGEGSVKNGSKSRRRVLLCVFHIQLYALLAVVMQMFIQVPVSIFFGAELRELHSTGLSLTYWSKYDPALTDGTLIRDWYPWSLFLAGMLIDAVRSSLIIPWVMALNHVIHPKLPGRRRIHQWGVALTLGCFLVVVLEYLLRWFTVPYDVSFAVARLPLYLAFLPYIGCISPCWSPPDARWGAFGGMLLMPLFIYVSQNIITGQALTLSDLGKLILRLCLVLISEVCFFFGRVFALRLTTIQPLWRHVIYLPLVCYFSVVGRFLQGVLTNVWTGLAAEVLALVFEIRCHKFAWETDVAAVRVYSAIITRMPPCCHKCHKRRSAPLPSPSTSTPGQQPQRDASARAPQQGSLAEQLTALQKEKGERKKKRQQDQGGADQQAEDELGEGDGHKEDSRRPPIALLQLLFAEESRAFYDTVPVVHFLSETYATLLAPLVIWLYSINAQGPLHEWSLPMVWIQGAIQIVGELLGDFIFIFLPDRLVCGMQPSPPAAQQQQQQQQPLPSLSPPGSPPLPQDAASERGESEVSIPASWITSFSEGNGAHNNHKKKRRYRMRPLALPRSTWQMEMEEEREKEAAHTDTGAGVGAEGEGEADVALEMSQEESEAWESLSPSDIPPETLRGDLGSSSATQQPAKKKPRRQLSLFIDSQPPVPPDDVADEPPSPPPLPPPILTAHPGSPTHHPGDIASSLPPISPSPPPFPPADTPFTSQSTGGSRPTPADSLTLSMSSREGRRPSASSLGTHPAPAASSSDRRSAAGSSAFLLFEGHKGLATARAGENFRLAPIMEHRDTAGGLITAWEGRFTCYLFFWSVCVGWLSLFFLFNFMSNLCPQGNHGGTLLRGACIA